MFVWTSQSCSVWMDGSLSFVSCPVLPTIYTSVASSLCLATKRRSISRLTIRIPIFHQAHATMVVVSQENFATHLPAILRAVASSQAVALSCEFTGIPRGEQARRHPRHPEESLPTLQHVYSETRAAAARYGILQIGLTFIRDADRPREAQLETYAFNLDPLVSRALQEHLGMERDVAFLTSSMRWVADRSGGNVTYPTVDGIKYLSRAESRALEAELDGFIGEIGNGKGDEALIWEIKRTLRDRLMAAKVEADFKGLSVTIKCLKDKLRGHKTQADKGLVNRYRKVVRYFLATEFPHLQLGGLDPDNGGISVTRRLETTSPSVGFRASEIFETMGLACVMEVLAKATGKAGNLNGKMDELACLYFWPCEGISKAIENIRVRAEPLILVGHHIFEDLIYLYKSFFEGLPAHVEGFKDVIHGLFPRVVDIRAVHSCDWENKHRRNLSVKGLDSIYGGAEQSVCESIRLALFCMRHASI
jgi:poly(A)-specific ribonuclease